MTKKQSRRHFLQNTIGIAGAGLALPSLISSKVSGGESGSDRPRIGCIGVGNMGTTDAYEHNNFGDIVAVCDVDSRHAAKAKQDPKIGKGKADVYKDYRHVLDRKDIDVVSIVTPDHWHIKPAIEALMAGKHIFIQKPLTLTLEENQLIRNACKKYGSQVVTVGTQQRSSGDHFLRAINMVQKGLLGDITKVLVGIDGGRIGGPFQKEKPPAELDWDRWLGQTPKVDYIKRRCHYEFRWWYEYSGGKFTDWGAHHIDIALWALRQNGGGMGPVEIDGTDVKHSVSYKDGYATVDDCFNTSHSFSVKCKFDSGLEMEVTSRSRNGVLFEGTKGRIFVARGILDGTPIKENWDKDLYTTDDRMHLYKGKPFEGHKNNFYRCIREGGLPVSDVFSHVQALNVCHLCAIAGRLGRVIKWDPKSEKIVDDKLAASFFSREQRKGYEIPRVSLDS